MRFVTCISSQTRATTLACSQTGTPAAGEPSRAPGAADQRGVDLANGVPGRFVKLETADDGAAEDQARLAGGDHHTDVVQDVSWYE
jgi:hypothetical protein